MTIPPIGHRRGEQLRVVHHWEVVAFVDDKPLMDREQTGQADLKAERIAALAEDRESRDRS